MAKRHFEAVAHRKDGSFALVSSSLTGRVWDGSVWVFRDYADYEQCPNLDMTATKSTAGNSDVIWLSGEENLVVASDSGEVEVWNCHPPGNTVEYRHSLGSHDDMVLCVAGLSDGVRVVSGSADRRVITWDVESQSEASNYMAHTDMVLSVASHPSSAACFLSTSQDGTVVMWDIRKPIPASKFTVCRSVVHTCAVWSQVDESTLALGCESGEVELFDQRWMSHLFLNFKPHARAVHRLTFAPDSAHFLASVSDDCRASVWSLKTNSSSVSFRHEDFARGLSWSPSEPLLLSCAWDGCLVQHSVTTTPTEEDSKGGSGGQGVVAAVTGPGDCCGEGDMAAASSDAAAEEAGPS